MPGKPPPVVMVVGDQSATQTKHQIDALRAAGAEVRNLSPGAGSPHLSVSWDEGGFRFGEVRLDEVNAVFVRGLPALSPGKGVFQAAGGQLDFASWFQHSCVQRDRHDTVFGLCLALEARGVPFFNPPSKTYLSRRKPFQLDVMRRLKLAFPATLITNRSDEARRFVQEHAAVIAKPASGGALTLDDKQLDDDAFAHLRMAPAIFQERIFGRDLRVMVLDGEVISAVAVGVPEDTLDFRGDPEYQRGTIAYDEVELPAAVQTQAGLLAKTLGLPFAGVDIKHVEATDRYFILEANSSPIYLDVERKLAHPITEQLAKAVVSAAHRHAELKA